MLGGDTGAEINNNLKSENFVVCRSCERILYPTEETGWAEAESSGGEETGGLRMLRAPKINSRLVGLVLFLVRPFLLTSRFIPWSYAKWSNTTTQSWLVQLFPCLEHDAFILPSRTGTIGGRQWRSGSAWIEVDMMPDASHLEASTGSDQFIGLVGG